MRLNIEHHIHYAYPDAVDYTIQQLHLTPRDGFGQRVKHWEIRVNGRMQPYADAYGNLTHTLVVDGLHSTVDITASGEVETELDIFPFPELLPLQVYLRATKFTSADQKLAEFARMFGKADEGLDQIGVQALMYAVQDHVIHETGCPEKKTTAAEAFAAGTGDSRDRTHVFIACCRHLGIPARYVSGYLFNSDRQMVDNHSWADVWVEGGWQSYDIDSCQRTNGIHVRMAVGLDGREAGLVNAVSYNGSTSSSSQAKSHSVEQFQQ